MKYMGSKTALLGGELGDILLGEAADAGRFVDLFAGSGVVAHFVAQRTRLPVLSVDLQEYARILAAAVIERTRSLKNDTALAGWLRGAECCRRTPDKAPLTTEKVHRERAEASKAKDDFITRHYGGHYFSLFQARTFDLLRRSLPEAEPSRTVALASLLQAASVCAAAPGHTAQPFQPTDSLLPFIEQAWSRNAVAAVHAAIDRISPVFAQTRGTALVGQAESTMETLNASDLVFCDPPYSAAQYSRFYHVLEGIARGGWDEVGGSGRAPARSSRKTSEFSMKSKAPAAMKSLLNGLHQRGCRVIITFPNAEASNGLSSRDIIAMAADKWLVEPRYVDSVHSTLGGANDGRRGGRKLLKEAVIILRPRPVALAKPVGVLDSTVAQSQSKCAV